MAGQEIQGVIAGDSERAEGDLAAFGAASVVGALSAFSNHFQLWIVTITTIVCNPGVARLHAAAVVNQTVKVEVDMMTGLCRDLH